MGVVLIPSPQTMVRASERPRVPTRAAFLLRGNLNMRESLRAADGAIRISEVLPIIPPKLMSKAPWKAAPLLPLRGLSVSS